MAESTEMEMYQELFLPLDVVKSSPGFSFDIGMYDYLKQNELNVLRVSQGGSCGRKWQSNIRRSLPPIKIFGSKSQIQPPR